MSLNIHIVFYSMYGHTWRLAEAEAEGARRVPDTAVRLFQCAELVPQAALEQSGAAQARQAFSHVPLATPDALAQADALIFGTPTRFGNMCAQMRNLLDQTTGLWLKGALIDKVASVFTSTATQHGGQETTITSFHSTLLHHGMIVLGVPYAVQGLLNMREITGGTPYGASTLADVNGARTPSANELTIAAAQGERVARLAHRLRP